MKTKLLYISIISLLFIIQACKRTEPDCGDLSDVITNYNISDADKAKIPYTGTDTLVFISDANDTATLIGQGKNSYYETIKTNISGGDCPRTKVDKNETIDIEYSGNNNDLHTIKYNIHNSKDKTSIEYYINNIYGQDYPYYLNTTSFYIDSVAIHGKYFRGTSIILPDVLNAVYNYNYGFLKIQFIGGKTWYLKL